MCDTEVGRFAVHRQIALAFYMPTAYSLAHPRVQPVLNDVMGCGYYNCSHTHDYITLVGDTHDRYAGEQAMEFERAMM